MKHQTKFLAFTALFSAIIAILAQISIPLPGGIPITLQTFAIALCGYYLGWKQGLIAVGVYLALGACGVPVFASFGGGLAKFTGMTGGYLWGFLPLVFCCGILKKRRWLAFLSGLLGLLLCHLCGIIQFSLVSGNGFWASFLVASAPYLIKDILSVFLAQLLALRLKNRLLYPTEQ